MVAVDVGVVDGELFEGGLLDVVEVLEGDVDGVVLVGLGVWPLGRTWPSW